MKKLSFRQIIRAINNYVVFFLTVGFAVSCCMMLFLRVLADSMGLALDANNIAVAAKLTFGNVLLITFLFGTADYIRRKITVERPVRQITQAAERIMQGDFSARVPPIHGAGTDGFNQIGSAINKMAQELSGTETLRTDFIANVSHELKTPLAVMGNYATMLQRPGITQEEKKEYAQAISAAAQRLAQLITNILKLNKLENQQIFPKTEEYDLGEQLCQALLQFEDVWERKNLTIETDMEDKW
jgi:signal transduction histidine kinase